MAGAWNKSVTPSRRTILKFGAVSAAAAALGVGRALEPSLARQGLLTKDGIFDAASMDLSGELYIEAFPTSPLILNPFVDSLLVPQPAKPIPPAVYRNWDHPPGLGKNQQNFISQLDANGDPVLDAKGKVVGAGNETHQIPPLFLKTNPPPDPNSNTPPIVYKFSVRSGRHYFTSSQVLPIDDNGRPTVSFDAAGRQYPAGTVRTLPPALIWGFADAGLPGTPKATFPGPMINAEYGKPVLVRFSDDITRADLDTNQDFGAPDGSFLTHLHNGHTAPESDGNPHYAMRGNPQTGTPTGGPHHEGFTRGSFVDQMYLNWPAGNDFREKQSFFWFHDHRMDHTGANVYKGMVGLYPLYDPGTEFTGAAGPADDGNENVGLRLPGIRSDNGDGSFSVKYDIPLAIFDCRFDDGVTIHKDFHDGQGEFPQAGNPRTHPEWWGLLFHKHFPNHGFVGDVFTVNGTAFPVLTVDRRKYRFRFLDASVSRIYEFQLMTSTQGPKSAVSLGYGGDELDGQYRIEDGQQCMKWTQIATDGGLLPAPIIRNSFELWPAKRREFIVDFTKYMDGTPTKTGDVIYLTNIMKMGTGRMWDTASRFSLDPQYKIPMMKIVIGGPAPDNSQVPPKMRPLPQIPTLAQLQAMMANRLIFEVQRGSAGGELEWLINGKPFDPFHELASLENPAGKTPTATPKEDSFNLWELRNGGGGWVHPIHIHQEEHRDITRNGVFEIDANGNPRVDPGHPDDASREDLAALDPGESVIVYRGFRDFVGPYVAHCHNLLHEDHAMMFGWTIT